MRCGQAYGLDGGIKAGSRPQNRVVLDGLVEQPHSWIGCSLPQAEVMPEIPVCWEPASGLVQWQLQIISNDVSIKNDGEALLEG